MQGNKTQKCAVPLLMFGCDQLSGVDPIISLINPQAQPSPDPLFPRFSVSRHNGPLTPLSSSHLLAFILFWQWQISCCWLLTCQREKDKVISFRDTGHVLPLKHLPAGNDRHLLMCCLLLCYWWSHFLLHIYNRIVKSKKNSEKGKRWKIRIDDKEMMTFSGNNDARLSDRSWLGRMTCHFWHKWNKAYRVRRNYKKEKKF
jgi:hypothetical protein